MFYDDALRATGGMGRYQWLIMVCGGVSSASVAMSAYAFVFIISTGNYWCKDPSATTFNMTFNDTENITSRGAYMDTDQSKYRKCTYHGVGQGATSVSNNLTSRRVGCQHGWVYEDADIETTITMEWDLVCHREHIAGLTQTLYMGGMLVGVLSAGIFADRFGRFKIVALGQIILTISGIVTSFSVNVAMFSVLRFVAGAASLCTSSTLFVICMEIVTPEKRAVATSVRYLFWTSGMLLTVGAAYAFRHWRTFLLVATVPSMLSTILLLVLPESPRWLYTKGRYREADAVMAKFAKWNGYPRLLVRVETTKEGRNDSREKNGILKSICKYPKLSLRVIIVAFVWLAVVLGFFGLTFNSISLGNKYLNFTISAVIELPTYITVWLSLDRLGRRIMTGVPLLVGGGFLLLTMAVPSDPEMTWVVIGMSTIGKLGAAMSFASLFPYTTELFPTVIRNTVLGFVSTCGRIGTLIAPQLALLSMHNKYIPPAVFGSLSSLAGMSTFFLPETTGLPLPETLEDGERMALRKPNDSIEIGETKEEDALALEPSTEECAM